MGRGFTLIDLIIVIIIVGILAAVGLTQYSTTVEKSRLAEAKVRIGAMRDLVQEYFMDNGTTTGITNSYLGVDNTCTSESFFKYSVGGPLAMSKSLIAERCQAGAGGKSPGATTYYFYFKFYPGTGQGAWYCCSGIFIPVLPGSECRGVGCFGLPRQ